MRAGRVRRLVGSANALPPVRPVIAGRPWARRLRREGQGGPSPHPRLCRDGPAPHGPMGPRGYGSMAASPHRTVRWEGHVSQEPADPTASSAPPDGTSPTIPSEAVDVQPEPLPVDGEPRLAATGRPTCPTTPRRRTRRCGSDLRRDECRHPGGRDGGGASGRDRRGRAGRRHPSRPSRRCRGCTRGAGRRGEADQAVAAEPAATEPPRRGPWRAIATVLLLVLLAAALGFGGAFLVPALVDVPVPAGALATTPAASPTPAPTTVELHHPQPQQVAPGHRRRPGPRRRRGHRARSTSSSAATSCPPSPPASVSRSRPSWTPTASRTPTTSNRASGSSSRCPEGQGPRLGLGSSIGVFPPVLPDGAGPDADAPGEALAAGDAPGSETS